MWSPTTVMWSDEMCRIFGLDLGTRGDYASYLELIHPEDRPTHQATRSSVVPSPVPATSPSTTGSCARTATVRWVSGRGVIERDADGTVLAHEWHRAGHHRPPARGRGRGRGDPPALPARADGDRRQPRQQPARSGPARRTRRARAHVVGSGLRLLLRRLSDRAGGSRRRQRGRPGPGSRRAGSNGGRDRARPALPARRDPQPGRDAGDRAGRRGRAWCSCSPTRCRPTTRPSG